MASNLDVEPSGAKWPILAHGEHSLALAVNHNFPEGFSMPAGVQHFLLTRRAVRVDKLRAEKAEGFGYYLLRKSADG